jgi:hypothetical protein
MSTKILSFKIIVDAVKVKEENIILSTEIKKGFWKSAPKDEFNYLRAKTTRGGGGVALINFGYLVHLRQDGCQRYHAATPITLP